MSKVVVRIIINMDCMETYPCRHFCMLHYDDGSSTEKTTLDAREVCKYWNLLSDKAKEHFSYARNLGNIL